MLRKKRPFSVRGEFVVVLAVVLAIATAALTGLSVYQDGVIRFQRELIHALQQ